MAHIRPLLITRHNYGYLYLLHLNLYTLDLVLSITSSYLHLVCLYIKLSKVGSNLAFGFGLSCQD